MAFTQWRSLSIKVAGTLRVPSAISFNPVGYGIWKMPATFQSDHQWAFTDGQAPISFGSQEQQNGFCTFFIVASRKLNTAAQNPLRVNKVTSADPEVMTTDGVSPMQACCLSLAAVVHSRISSCSQRIFPSW